MQIRFCDGCTLRISDQEGSVLQVRRSGINAVEYDLCGRCANRLRDVLVGHAWAAALKPERPIDPPPPVETRQPSPLQAAAQVISDNSSFSKIGILSDLSVFQSARRQAVAKAGPQGDLHPFGKSILLAVAQLDIYYASVRSAENHDK